MPVNRNDDSCAYSDACRELADALGWDAGTVRHWWRELSLMRRYEQRWPVALAEWAAWRDVIVMFDKRGTEAD